MPVDVSIIMPAYNAERFIAEAIASVQRQRTTAAWELLISDDGSTDGTADAARKAADGDDRVIIGTHPHSGLPATARNRALARAQGRLIAFLDADDLWEEGKLQTQIGAMDGEDTWSFANSRFFSGGQNSPDGLKYPPDWRPARPFFPQLFTTEGVPFLTVMTTSSLLRRIANDAPPFNEDPRFKAVEDWDLTLRLARIAEPVYIQAPLARYRAHTGGISKAHEASFERASALIGSYRRQGIDPALCNSALRLQRSKRASGRMLAGDPAWRGEMLSSCFPPQNARDACFVAMSILPRTAARRLYSAGLARKRQG